MDSLNTQKSDIELNALMIASAIEDPIASIKKYIEMISEEDYQLKESLKNPEKNFDKCYEYIKKRAEQYLNKKPGHVAPIKIYGWATHYFIETDDHLKNELGIKEDIKPTSTNKNITKVSNQRPKRNITETAQERMARIKKSVMLSNGE